MHQHPCIFRGFIAASIFVLAAAPPTHGAWTRHAIDGPDKNAGRSGADGVRVADVNGDGLMDITTGWEQGGAVRVYLNPGPGGAKKKWPAVTAGNAKGVEDAVFADLDGDGGIDVVSSTEGKNRTVYFHWAPAEKDRCLDSTAWATEAVPATAGEQAWMFALPLDLDGRNGIDIVLGSKGSGAAMGWLESPANPRDAAAWKYHRLHDASWVMSIRAFDMDGDGDGDILYTDRKGDDSGVFWLENPGRKATASGAEWPRHLYGHAGREVMFLDLSPGRPAGDPAIAVAVKEGDVRVGPEGHIPLPDTAGTGKAVRWGHIGGTPEIDLVLTCENAKGDLSGAWWYALGRKSGWHDISGPEGVKYDRIELLDLDKDGDLDVITCEERDDLGVIWYENPG